MRQLSAEGGFESRPPSRLAATAAAAAFLVSTAAGAERPRAREAGVEIGILAPGPLNAITDVAGVAVGHRTLVEGERSAPE
jgi:D-aminopeptidase